MSACLIGSIFDSVRCGDDSRGDEIIPSQRYGTKQELSFAALQHWRSGGVWAISALMLSVVIETRNSEDALARTLASLVSGAVEGVVREVIICDQGSSDHTHSVADHAGCHYLANAHVAAGVRQARSEWLMFLEPGARLRDGWTEAVVAHAEAATGAARFTRARQSRQPFLERMFSGSRPLVDGLIITKRQALSLARGDGSAGAIAKSVSARRLGAEIVAAQAPKPA